MTRREIKEILASVGLSASDRDRLRSEIDLLERIVSSHDPDRDITLGPKATEALRALQRADRSRAPGAPRGDVA